jgi:hypothetical protein
VRGEGAAVLGIIWLVREYKSNFLGIIWLVMVRLVLEPMVVLFIIYNQCLETATNYGIINTLNFSLKLTVI